MKSDLKKNRVFFLSSLTFGGFVVWLTAVAAGLKCDYFDSYSVLLNARALAWFRPEEYFWNRFPLLPIVLSPFFKLEQIFFGKPFAWVACHILAVIFYVLWVWAAYRLIRLFGTRPQALLGAGLLASNRLVLHFSPFCRDDIPGALLVTAAFYFYLRGFKTHRLREPLLAGLCWGLAMMMRFTMILPAVVSLAVFESAALIALWKKGASQKKFITETLKRIGFSACVPAGLFFLVLGGLYHTLHLAAWFEAPQKIIQEIFLMRDLASVKQESVTETFFFLGRSMTWPIFTVSFAGMLLSLKHKRPQTGPLLFWALFFWFYFSVILANKEARYLFPLLVPFYYFSSFFLIEISNEAARWTSGWKRGLLFAAGSVFFFALPIQQAASECLRFSNPIYKADFAQRVSEGAKEMAGPDGNIYWAGKLYALHDRDPLFHPQDEYTYLYHVYGHTLMFYTGRWINGFPEARFFLGVDPETQMRWALTAGLGAKLQDGDVLVMNLEPGSYSVVNLPARMGPLLAAKVRKLTFGLKTKNEKTLEARYQRDDGAFLSLRKNPDREDGGRILTGQGLDAGFYEVYFKDTDGKILRQGFAHAGRGGLESKLPPSELPEPHEVILLTYSEVRAYAHPE